MSAVDRTDLFIIDSNIFSLIGKACANLGKYLLISDILKLMIFIMSKKLTVMDENRTNRTCQEN
jgi:hypothetical protein